MQIALHLSCIFVFGIGWSLELDYQGISSLFTRKYFLTICIEGLIIRKQYWDNTWQHIVVDEANDVPWINNFPEWHVLLLLSTHMYTELPPWLYAWFVYVSHFPPSSNQVIFILEIMPLALPIKQCYIQVKQSPCHLNFLYFFDCAHS